MLIKGAVCRQVNFCDPHYYNIGEHTPLFLFFIINKTKIISNSKQRGSQSEPVSDQRPENHLHALKKIFKKREKEKKKEIGYWLTDLHRWVESFLQQRDESLARIKDK